MRANPSGRKVCFACGATLSGTVNSANILIPEKPQEEAEKTGNSAVKFLIAIIFAAVITGFGGIVLLKPIYDDHKLKSAAEGYLGALKTGSYTAAYGFLSAGSKKYCTLPRFKALQSASSTSASGITVFKKDNTDAIIKYTDAKGEAAYATFTRENGDWVKPYIPDLLVSVVAAQNAGNPAHALHLAKTAKTIDPLSPITAAILCQAQFSNGLYRDAVESCSSALLKQEYPAGFSPADSALYQYYLAAGYLKAGRRDDARKTFEKIMSVPQAPAKVLCQARLAYPRTLDKTADRTGIISHLQETVTQCPDPADKTAAYEMLDILTGKNTAEAISYGRKYKETPSSLSLEALWLDDKTGIARREGHTTQPKDLWQAIAAEPGVYRVRLQLGPGTDSNGNAIPPKTIWTLSVDLWGGSVKMEQ